MERAYVLISFDKKCNSQIFYDYEKKEFFISPQQKKSSIASFSAFAGVLFYALFKDFSFDTGLHRLTIALLSVILGMILSFANIKMTMTGINKRIKTRKEVVIPTKEEIQEYVTEGRRRIKKLFTLIIFLFLLSIFGSFMLLVTPTSLLFMLISPAMWTGFIIFIWGSRPIKRNLIYRKLEIALPDYEGASRS